MLCQYCQKFYECWFGECNSTEFYVYLYLAIWLVIYGLCFFSLWSFKTKQKPKQNIFVDFFIELRRNWQGVKQYKLFEIIFGCGS